MVSPAKIKDYIKKSKADADKVYDQFSTHSQKYEYGERNKDNIKADSLAKIWRKRKAGLALAKRKQKGNTMKNIKENEMIRTPEQKKLFNQEVIMSPLKFSEPTKDNNVFNAANLGIHAGKRTADQTDNIDDQSAGYKTPIMFGDYVDYIMKMRNEGVELDADDENLLAELAGMDEKELDALLEEMDTMVIGYLDEETEEEEVEEGTEEVALSKLGEGSEWLNSLVEEKLNKLKGIE